MSLRLRHVNLVRRVLKLLIPAIPRHSLAHFRLVILRGQFDVEGGFQLVVLMRASFPPRLIHLLLLIKEGDHLRQVLRLAQICIHLEQLAFASLVRLCRHHAGLLQ